MSLSFEKQTNGKYKIVRKEGKPVPKKSSDDMAVDAISEKMKALKSDKDKKDVSIH